MPSLVLTGLSPITFQVGCVGFSAAYALLEALVMLLVALPWAGANLAGASLSGIALSLLGGVVGLLGFSTLLSAVVLRVGDRLVVESVAFGLHALASGVAVPAEMLPAPLRILGETLPLTWMLRMLRESVLHADAPEGLAKGALALLAIGVAHGALGLLVLRPVLRDALRTPP